MVHKEEKTWILAWGFKQREEELGMELCWESAGLHAGSPGFNPLHCIDWYAGTHPHPSTQGMGAGESEHRYHP